MYAVKKSSNVPPVRVPVTDIVPVSLSRLAGSSVTNRSKNIPPMFIGAMLLNDNAVRWVVIVGPQ